MRADLPVARSKIVGGQYQVGVDPGATSRPLRTAPGSMPNPNLKGPASGTSCSGPEGIPSWSGTRISLVLGGSCTSTRMLLSPGSPVTKLPARIRCGSPRCPEEVLGTDQISPAATKYNMLPSVEAAIWVMPALAYSIRLVIRPLEMEAIAIVWRGWAPIRKATSESPIAANGPLISSAVLTNGIGSLPASPSIRRYLPETNSIHAARPPGRAAK